MFRKFEIKEYAKFKKVIRVHILNLEDFLQLIDSLNKIGNLRNHVAEIEVHALLILMLTFLSKIGNKGNFKWQIGKKTLNI